MQSRIKTIASGVVLAFVSVTSYYLFALSYLGIGGGIYSINNSSFDTESFFSLLLGFLILVGFLAGYIISVVYLCKQLYAAKKWMVFIPILASVLIALLGFLLIWRDFQFE